MSTEKRFTYPSSDGRSAISAMYVIPDGEIRAVLQIAHGMCERKERYLDFAGYLAENGILTALADHAGHGASVKNDDDLGYVESGDPCRVWTDDLGALRALTEKEYPSAPYFMLGHSMGSYLLRSYLPGNSEGLAGAIVMGTGTVPPGLSSFALKLVGLATLLKGARHRSLFIQKLTYGKSYEGYDLTFTDDKNCWLTKDGAIVRKYHDDPKCGFLFTLSGHKGLFTATKRACSPQSAAMISKDMPVFIVSGDRDPVGDLGGGVVRAYEMYTAAGMTNVMMKLYPGDRHEILNELDRAEVYADMLAFIEKNI